MSGAPSRTRALLLQPPICLDEDFIDYPPLITYATAMTAAALRANGCEVVVIDAGCLPGVEFVRTENGWRWGVEPERYLEHLRGEIADVVVVSQSVFQYTDASVDVLRRVLDELNGRTPRPLIALADQSPGGMHRLDLPQEYRRAQLSGFDTLLAYESDGAVAELLSLWRDGRELPLVINGHADDLDALPSPAWDLIDLDNYQSGLRSAGQNRNWFFSIDSPSVPFLTSRGCPYRCNFCFPEAAWRAGAKVGAFRALSLGQIGVQLSDLAARGIRHLNILDATINGDTERFKGLLSLLEGHEFTIDIPNGMRADLLDRDDIARLQPLLGELSISAESGDPEIVRRVVGKNLDLRSIRNVASICCDVGLPLSIHWMIGQPGETVETIDKTLSLAWELFDKYAAMPLVQFAIPFAGTRLYREAVENGMITADPSDISKMPSRIGSSPVLDIPDVDGETLMAMKSAFDQRLRLARDQRRF